jgi:hypothetical protein
MSAKKCCSSCGRVGGRDCGGTGLHGKERKSATNRAAYARRKRAAELTNKPTSDKDRT